jgi:hypothetical protein
VFALLQGALESSLCLEEVDLTACALSDKGADIMAAVIRVGGRGA